jgi:hypothetical protein
MSRRYRFTQEEDATLIRMVGDGQSAKQIGRVLDRSPACIYHRAKGLGVRFTRQRSRQFPADAAELRLAKLMIAGEIARARAEWHTAPPYKPSIDLFL